MNIKDGQLIGNKTQNMKELEIKKVIKTIKKFKEYNIENFITYQRVPLNNNPHQKINESISGDSNN
jgi:hypothetical protein